MNNQTNEISVWDVDPVSSMLQRIHFQFVSKRLRSLSVVSEARGEGKTTVAMLLARGLSEVYGFKVILIDLNSQGDSLLSKYLKDYQTVDGIVAASQFPFSILRIKDLDIDWSKNIFDGPYVNRLVTSYTSTFDIVIVDNPTPVNTNESLLKINTDTNLIVCSKTSTLNDKCRLKIELNLNKKNIIGVVYNRLNNNE